MNNSRKSRTLIAAQLQTPLGVQALTLLLIIAVWELIGRTGILFAELFPPLIEIMRSLWTYVTTPLILPHLNP